jgi:hypothetical protein
MRRVIKRLPVESVIERVTNYVVRNPIFGSQGTERQRSDRKTESDEVHRALSGQQTIEKKTNVDPQDWLVYSKSFGLGGAAACG